MTVDRYTCPCCGFQTLSAPPGSFDICHVCFWEDDAVQLLDPWRAGGANRLNLVEAQASYAACGAVEERFLQYVKGVLPTDARDSTWRRVADYDRVFTRRAGDLSANEHGDLDAWYYWRKSIS